MKSLLTISAVLEGLTGLTLALMPSLVVPVLLGTDLNDTTANLMCRLAGGALVAIAYACWLSRNDTKSSNMVKVMLLYNLFSIVLLIYAVVGEKVSGPGLWPTVVLHIGLLGWCLTCLFKGSEVSRDYKVRSL